MTLIGFLILLSSFPPQDIGMPEPQLVSMIRLIQVPEEFHEKKVRVVGVAALEFEHKAVYVSSEDHRNSVTKNALWLDVELTEESKALDSKYVLVEGTFDMASQGHLKMYSGTIHVERLEEWSNQEAP